LALSLILVDSAMSTLPACQPDAPDRIHTLDALRGIALLGMILVHFHNHSLEVGGFNDLIRTAIWRLVESKSHGMFALLFGAGFALQLRRAESRATPFALIYFRRLTVLAVFGFAAHALFGYNVLLGYAVWGAPLLLIRNWSTGALIAAALISACSMTIFGLFCLAVLGAEGDQAWVDAHRQAAIQMNQALHDAVNQTDYGVLLRARLHHMAWFYAQPFCFLPGPTMTLFIAGLLAVRHGILERPLAHKGLNLTIMLVGVVGWTADSWLPRIYFLFGLLRDEWLTFTYTGALLLLLARFPRLLQLLRPVGQAGRMALTNYLLQIATLDVLFSGYALHLPDFRPVFGPPAAIALFGALATLSSAWLARFHYGPAEWAWRSLTYGRAQPMLK
jgi:uncharacterized protein